MTLALLLTAVTGAWADGIVCTASDLGKVLCTDGSIYENELAATTADKTAVAVIAYVDETNKNGLAIALADESSMNWSTAVSTCEGKTPTVTGANWCLPSQDQWKQMFKANGGSETSYTGLNTTIYNAGGATLQDWTDYWSSTPVDGENAWVVSTENNAASWNQWGMSFGCQVRACLAFDITESAIDVTWNATTKTGTFTMPAFDVEIDPIYAPTAMFATDGNLVLTPTAIEGVFAESTDAIVKAGTVAKIGETENVQGTLMYAVTSTNQAIAPALTAFSADVPTAKDITVASDVLVWYYIKGADTPQGQEATAENTFNDSEICATPITVNVLSNKFDIQFNAANDNTIEAGKATVTVGGTAATVTEGKLEGVKMGSEVKMTAKQGYKFRKVEVKKSAAPRPLAEAVAADLGKIVGADGKIYATKAAAEAVATGNAVAMIAYVGTASDCAHGLAIALADESGTKDFGAAGTACSGKAAVTGGTWRLPSIKDWQYMFIGCGASGSYSDNPSSMSYSGLASKLTTAQGDALQPGYYWSSTEYFPGTDAWDVSFDGSSNASFGPENESIDSPRVRACLAF